MLLTLVILCILDCALVLGELTLDLYKVKGKQFNRESHFMFTNNLPAHVLDMLSYKVLQLIYLQNNLKNNNFL